MLTLSRQLVCLVVLATGACSAPSGSSTSSLSSSPTETSSASTSVSRETRTVSPASTASNAAAYMPDADVTPMPTRGKLGANILGPMNVCCRTSLFTYLIPRLTGCCRSHSRSRIPTSSHLRRPIMVMCTAYLLSRYWYDRSCSEYSLHRPNAKWPFALSHQRLQSGGWARQQNSKLLHLVTEYSILMMFLAVHQMPIATRK